MREVHTETDSKRGMNSDISLSDGLDLLTFEERAERFLVQAEKEKGEESEESDLEDIFLPKPPTQNFEEIQLMNYSFSDAATAATTPEKTSNDLYLNAFPS